MEKPIAIESSSKRGLSPFLITAVVLGLLASPLLVTLIRWEILQAKIHDLSQAARKFGGGAYIPPGAIDFWRVSANVELDLSKAGITSSDLDMLVRMGERVRWVQYVSLAQTQVTDSGLAALERLPNLYGLTLAGTEITNRSLETIAKLRRLDTLNLSGTAITDDALPTLIALRESVRLLDLTDTAFSDEAARKLIEAYKTRQATIVYGPSSDRRSNR
jgi:hypothetical protein